MTEESNLSNKQKKIYREKEWILKSEDVKEFIKIFKSRFVRGNNYKAEDIHKAMDHDAGAKLI